MTGRAPPPTPEWLRGTQSADEFREHRRLMKKIAPGRTKPYVAERREMTATEIAAGERLPDLYIDTEITRKRG